MKKTIRNLSAYISGGLCLAISLLTYQAGATITTWDPEGTALAGNTNASGFYTGSLTGTWETAKWSTSESGQATPVSWVESTDAEFAAHSGTGTPAFTVTMNANHTVTAIWDGPQVDNPCPVTITGTGVMTVNNVAGFSVNNNTGDPGTITINNVIAGTGTIVKGGSGTLQLNGANTITGSGNSGTSFQISGAGSATFGNNAAFGAGSVLWSVSGFIQPAVAGTAYNIANPMTHFLNGTETFAGNTGGVTFSGAWTLPASGTLTLGNIANTITVSGPIGGASALLLKVSGTGAGWTFTGVNTYTGGTSVTNGILTIGGAGQLGSGSYAGNMVISNGASFIYNSSASQTLSGIISGAGPLTQSGSGKLTLSGANTYTGTTTNAGGILALNHSETAGTSGPMGKSAAANPGSIVMSGGTLQYSSANKVDYTGRFSTAANQAYNIDVNGQAVTFATALSSSGGALKVNDTAGGGVLTLSTANTFTGGATINAGSVSLGGSVASPFGTSAGTLTLAGGTILCSGDRGTTANNILNPVNLTGNFAFAANTTTGTRNLVFGGTLNGTAGTLTIHNTEATNGGATLAVRFTNTFAFAQPITLTVDTAGNSAEMDIWNRADLGDQTYSGIISGNGSILRSITTAGTGGRVILSATNTYTGGTGLNDGELAFATSSSGPADAPVNGPIGTGTLTVGNNGGKLSANGGPQVVGNHVFFSGKTNLAFVGTNSLEMSGNFDFDNLTVRLTVSNTNTTLLSGSITNGGLTVLGGNTLTLSGVNGYSGATTISNNSTLALTATGSISNSASIVIAAGSTLDVSAFSAYSLGTSTVSASGGATPATINGASGGTVDFGSQPITLTYDGFHPALSIAQATLLLNGNTFTVNGSHLVAGVYTLIQQATGSITALGSFGVSGTAFATGSTGVISVSGGSVLLTVFEAPVFSALTAAPSITYGGTSVILSGTVSGAGPVYPSMGDTVSITIDGQTVNGTISDSTGDFSINFNDPSLPVFAAGNFPIIYAYAGNPAVLLNAATNDTSTSLTINPAALSITASGQVKTYGGTAPAVTPTLFSSIGLQNGETIGDVNLAYSGTPSGDSTNAPVSGSPYAILPSGATGGTFNPANYTITYNAGSLVVNPAALTVIASAQSKSYGQALTPLVGSTNFTSSSLQNGETIGSVTLAVSGTPSGDTTNAPVSGSPYTITPSAATDGTFTAGNYTITYNTGLLTVTPASLTVTADDFSRAFGATNPVFTFTFTNFVNGETLGTSDVGGSPALTSVDTNADIGAYAITNAIGTLTSTNYSFSLVNGTLTVTNAFSTNAITADVNPALPGATVTFTATLSALAPSTVIPSGSVQFLVDGTNYGAPVTLTNGVAVTTSSTVPHGNHNIEADYAGVTNLAGGTNLVGSTNVLVELINTPPVAGPATFARPADVSLHINVSDLLTNATDADGDLISFVTADATSTNGATIVNTNSVGATNGIISYVPPSTNGNVTDTFNYTVQDIFGATNTGTVTITILPPDNGPSVNITGLVTLGDGTVQISFAGVPGHNYLIQATTNLAPVVNWTTISTNMAGTNGLFQYIDVDATNFPIRYYRTAKP